MKIEISSQIKPNDKRIRIFEYNACQIVCIRHIFIKYENLFFEGET